MTDLLTLLSAATGPSRELDAEIALANGWIRDKAMAYGGEYWKSQTGQICPNPPRYTESIDAAMTLVPKDLRWELWGGAKKRFRGEVWPLSPTAAVLVGFSDANAALALVIACLKARMEKDNAGQ